MVLHRTHPLHISSQQPFWVWHFMRIKLHPTPILPVMTAHISLQRLRGLGAFWFYVKYYSGNEHYLVLIIFVQNSFLSGLQRHLRSASSLTPVSPQPGRRSTSISSPFSQEHTFFRMVDMFVKQVLL